MAMRKAYGELVGNIRKRGGSVTYRVIFRGEIYRFNCHGSLRQAKILQREITNKIQRGEFGQIDYVLMPVQKGKKKNKADITPEEFMLKYESYLIRKAKRGKGASLEDVKKTEAYKNNIEYVNRFFEYTGVKKLSDLELELVLEKYVSVRQEEIEPQTVNRQLATIRAMLKHAHKLGYLYFNIGADIENLQVKNNKDITVFPDLRTIRTMFKKCEQHLPVFLPLLWTYMKTGVRRMDGIEFRKSWVKDHVNRVEVYADKPNKKYVIITDPDIHDLLLTLKNDPTNKTDFLFLDEKREPWTKGKVVKRIKILRKETGLSNKVLTPQTFRHTFGSCITISKGIAIASAFLGHGNIQLTKDHYANVYLDYVEMGDDELPYNIQTMHGKKVGNIILANNRFKVSKQNISNLSNA